MFFVVVVCCCCLFVVVFFQDNSEPMAYFQAILLMACFGFAYSDDTTCKPKGLHTCTCAGLLDGTVFVDCSRGHVKIEDACKICKNFQNVTKIDIAWNNLFDIPEDCFMYCYNVTSLSLASNGIRALKQNIFTGMKRLQQLNLDGNLLIKGGNISTPEAFDKLINLKSLSLKRNVTSVKDAEKYKYLANIKTNTFTSLQKLSLDGLPRGSFGKNFQNYKNLAFIDFSGMNSECNIVNLTSDSFRNVIYVTHLNLSKCQISNIDRETFLPMSRLRHLNLSHNMELGFVTLKDVAYGLRNTSIEVLDYSKVYKTFGVSNELKRCDIWYLNNTKLKELHLNSNRMASIEVNGMHLVPRSLEVFWAENNVFEYGPYLFQTGCVNNLKILEASKKLFGPDLTKYNDEIKINEKTHAYYDTDACSIDITSKRDNCPLLVNKKLKPEGISISTSLRRIKMSSSNLYFKLPDGSYVLNFNNSIEYMDFSSNIFYQWRGKFFRFNKLKFLDLSNNFCSLVTKDFFKNAPNITTLNISMNNLGLVLAGDTKGEIFKPLKRIKSLNVARNDIENLPKNVFKYLKHLQTLNISFYRIQKIEFDFGHMKNLSFLDVQQNKLYCLPVPLLEHMETNSKKKSRNMTIDMSKNLIHLSCKYLSFLSWMLDHHEYFKNIHSYRFHEKDGTVVSFSEFRPALERLQKNCQSYTAVYIVAAISMTAFVGLLLGGFGYRFRWRIRYFYYIAKAKYIGYQPIHDSDSQTYQYDAFVSYANEDGDFVKNIMVRNLEDEHGLRLCVHERDFTPGRPIAENIIQAIMNSRRTLVLLSKNFLKSKWCRYEFDMARIEGIYSREGESILFVVMYEDVDMTEMSHEMLECLETESFLKYQNDETEMQYFWQTLKESLLDRRQH